MPANNPDESDACSLGAAVPPPETRLYCKRWHMLAIFSLQTMLNAVIWISFAPIADLAQDFFDVGATAVNMCSLSFMILYLPGTMLASAVIARRELQAAGATWS